LILPGNAAREIVLSLGVRAAREIVKKVAAKVSLQEIVEALDSAHDESSSYVHEATGRVVTITDEDMRYAEKDNVTDLPEWQLNAVAEAKEVLDSSDWSTLPTKHEIHEWQILKEFVEAVPNPSQRSELADAIHGPGAFRAFKATVRRFGIEETWYAFRKSELERIAREWLKKNGFTVDAAAKAGHRSGSDE
jgi:hypothetical protein